MPSVRVMGLDSGDFCYQLLATGLTQILRFVATVVLKRWTTGCPRTTTAYWIFIDSFSALPNRHNSSTITQVSQDFSVRRSPGGYMIMPHEAQFAGAKRLKNWHLVEILFAVNTLLIITIGQLIYVNQCEKHKRNE